MSRLTDVLYALDERTLARKAGRPHDEARSRIPVMANTVPDWDALRQAITDYGRAHLGYTRGGNYPDHMIYGYVVEALTEIYGPGWHVPVSRHAIDGTQGGLKGVFDAIAEGWRRQEIRLHAEYVLDSQVNHLAWEERVEMIRELFDLCRGHLSPNLRLAEPEAYANDCGKIIASYVAWRNGTFSSGFWNPFPER